MADLNSKYNINTQEAVKNTATLSKSIDKVEASAKKSAAAIDKMNKAASSGGGGGGRYPNGHPGRGGGSINGVAGFVPGGASAQSQFRNIFRAIGIAGLGTVMKQLNDAVDANTKALLDKAKSQQDQSKIIALTDSQLKSNKVIVDELNKRNKNLKSGEKATTYENLRNELAFETATKVEDINSIFKSISENVRNFEELSNLTKEITSAAKLGVADIATLVDAEQKALAIKGQTPGSSTKSMGLLADDFKNVYMNIIDEIQGSKDIGMGTGIAKFYGDTKGEYKIEESMQKLNALMEENSLQGLRKYGGKQLEGKSGPEFLDALVQFTNERAKDIGITGEQTIDRYVERGDMSKEEADVFKEIYKNFDEFKNYLNTFDVKVDFGISSKKFQEQLETIKQSNVAFSQSIEQDRLKVGEDIIKSDPGVTNESKAQLEQDDFTKSMIEKGYGRLKNPETGQIEKGFLTKFLNIVSSTLGNSTKTGQTMTMAQDSIDKTINEMSTIPKYISKFIMNSPMFNIAQNAFDTGLKDLPFASSVANFNKTGKLSNDTVETTDSFGNKKQEFVLGAGWSALIDAVGLLAGGLKGSSESKKIVDNIAALLLKQVEKNIETKSKVGPLNEVSDFLKFRLTKKNSEQLEMFKEAQDNFSTKNTKTFSNEDIMDALDTLKQLDSGGSTEQLTRDPIVDEFIKKFGENLFDFIKTESKNDIPDINNIIKAQKSKDDALLNNLLKNNDDFNRLFKEPPPLPTNVDIAPKIFSDTELKNISKIFSENQKSSSGFMRDESIDFDLYKRAKDMPKPPPLADIPKGIDDYLGEEKNYGGPLYEKFNKKIQEEIYSIEDQTKFLMEVIEKVDKSNADLAKMQKSYASGFNRKMSTYGDPTAGASTGGSIANDLEYWLYREPDKVLTENQNETEVEKLKREREEKLKSLINNPMQFNQNIPTATSNMNTDEYIQNLTGSSPAPETSAKQENSSFVNDFRDSQKVRDEIAMRQLKVQEELLAETKRKSTQDQIELNKNANKPYNRNQFR
jgi:hypothetical protein